MPGQGGLGLLPGPGSAGVATWSPARARLCECSRCFPNRQEWGTGRKRRVGLERGVHRGTHPQQASEPRLLRGKQPVGVDRRPLEAEWGRAAAEPGLCRRPSRDVGRMGRARRRGTELLETGQAAPVFVHFHCYSKIPEAGCIVSKSLAGLVATAPVFPISLAKTLAGWDQMRLGRGGGRPGSPVRDQARPTELPACAPSDLTNSHSAPPPRTATRGPTQERS